MDDDLGEPIVIGAAPQRVTTSVTTLPLSRRS